MTADGAYIEEHHRQDALGRLAWRQKDPGGSHEPVWVYQYAAGRLIRTWEDSTSGVPAEWIPDTTYTIYDGDGNVRYTGTRTWWWKELSPSTYELNLDRRAEARYYGADGKMMFLQVTRDSLRYPAQWVIEKRTGIFEEYWYDPLGRRILTRSYGDSICTAGVPDCVPAITRTIWDGDQILYEVRYDGSDGEGDLDDAPPTTTGESSRPRYGWVAYTHGPGLDAPLDLIRMNYDSGNDPVTLLPHANWRGHYDFMTDTTGAQFGCAPYWSSGCPELALPGKRRRAGLDVYAWEQAPHWMGSLVLGQQDRSGLIYMRNRYYDPQTGQFTQQDPIGIAGGLNLYGFANGDPVNFSDPFGLCPWCLGAFGGVVTGFLLAKAAGADYSLGNALTDAALGAAGAGIVSKLDKLNDARRAARATRHGAERLADATRLGVQQVDDVVRNATRTYTQSDGAKVFVQEVGGRFNVVVRNEADELITNLKTISERALDRLARRYGWEP